LLIIRKIYKEKRAIVGLGVCMGEEKTSDMGADRATVGSQGFESLKEKAEALKGVKTKKVFQRFVWISPRSYAKVCELAEILKTSTSQVISLIIDDYFERGLNLLERKSEVQVKEVVVCPECGQGFESVAQWFEHLKNKNDEARSLVYKLLEFRK
jgi:hypothetical protein